MEGWRLGEVLVDIGVEKDAAMMAATFVNHESAYRADTIKYVSMHDNGKSVFSINNALACRF